MNHFVSILKKMLLVLCLGLLVSGFDLSPESLIKDISRMWEQTKPSVENVQFWDFQQEKLRGVRAFFYTLPQERQNRMVDKRLHDKMTRFLSYFCQEVITLDSFDNLFNKRTAELKIKTLADEWKLKGQVTPATLFSSPIPGNDSQPFIDVDLVVFLERVHYDHGWVGNRKKLAIGVNAAVFEMDYGLPIYNDSIMVESPWSGDSGTYVKAEHAVLLKVADEIGKSLQQLADNINQSHALLEKQKMQEQQQQKMELIQQWDEETKQLEILVRKAEEVIQSNLGPEDVLESLKKETEEIRPLMKIKLGGSDSNLFTNRKRTLQHKEKTQSMPEKDVIQHRRDLAQSIQDHLNTWESWKQQEEEERQRQMEIASQPKLNQEGVQANQATPSTQESESPILSKENLVSLPQIKYPKGNLFDRGWLLPSNRALVPGAVPIVSVTGTVPQDNILSSPIPQEVPESFRLLQPADLSPIPKPANPSGTVQSVTKTQTN